VIIRVLKGGEKMKRALIGVLAVVVCFTFLGTALAVAPGKTVEYPGGAEGKVIFDGKAHADAKLACKDCHPNPFAMKKAAKITKADHEAGKSCFTCHNGTKAFAQKDCAKCHKK
jgi:c(7)-type cytochrome triheme protein